MVMKKILIALALLLTGIASGSACTGISFLAEDGGYVQARTIEWGDSYLPSECYCSQRTGFGILYSNGCKWLEISG